MLIREATRAPIEQGIEMNDYLNAEELAKMIDCLPNSYACMRRWLAKHGWPFETNRRGFPQVSREYYKARMSGVQPAKAASDISTEPDFSMFT